MSAQELARSDDSLDPQGHPCEVPARVSPEHVPELGESGMEGPRAWPSGPARWPGVVAWICTLIAAVVVVWMGLNFLGRCTPGGIAQGAGEGAGRFAEGAGKGAAALVTSVGALLKPEITVSPLTVLRGADDSPKIIVYTHAADVEVPLEDEAWYGGTYTRALARNCRAQFVIPLDRMTDRDLVLVPGGNGEPARILVIAPRPRLDLEMLVIAPESIEFTERSTGLRRVTSLFAGPDRERMVRLIRPALVEAMADRALRTRVEEAGRRFFERNLAEMLRSELKVGRDVNVDVRWVDD